MAPIRQLMCLLLVLASVSAAPQQLGPNSASKYTVE